MAKKTAVQTVFLDYIGCDYLRAVWPKPERRETMRIARWIGASAVAALLASGVVTEAANQKSAKTAGATTPVADVAEATGNTPAPTATESAFSQGIQEAMDALETSSTAAANFEIPWQSVNGGGGPMSSASYSVKSSVGQAVIGFSTSTNYQAGQGYWYGAEAAGGGGGCACDCHADPQCDSVTNVLDVVQGVNVAFRGQPDIVDPNANCPYTTTDATTDGVTNVLDVVRLVNVAFRGGDPAIEFGDPCP